MLKKLILLMALILSFSVRANESLDETIDNTTKELSASLPSEEKLEDSAFTKYMSEKLKTVIAGYIQENPFSRMNEEELRSLIDVKLHDSSFGNYLKKSPRLYGTIIDLLRDKTAIPAFLSIINKGQSLKHFSLSIFAVFVLSFLYTTFFMKGSVFKKILKKIFVSAGVFVLDLGILYYFFGPELRPGLNIIFKHFHL